MKRSGANERCGSWPRAPWCFVRAFCCPSYTFSLESIEFPPYEPAVSRALFKCESMRPFRYYPYTVRAITTKVWFGVGTERYISSRLILDAGASERKCREIHAATTHP